MFVVDTPSCAHLPTVSTWKFAHSLEETDYAISLSLSTDQLLQVKHASRDDQALHQLREIHKKGWPLIKSDVAECLHAYFDYWDELIVQNELVCKDDLLVIPAMMCKEMIAVVHASYIGIQGCIRRACDIMFRPWMT